MEIKEIAPYLIFDGNCAEACRFYQSVLGGKPTVTDGPFVETKELIAGYWMINVKSKEEAIEWAKKVPFQMLPTNDGTPEIEIRQVFELEDFPNVPPEVAEQEKKFASNQAAKKG